MNIITELFESNLKESYTAPNGVIKNVSIMSSGISKNGRKYSQQAMKETAEKSNGVKMFLDHGSPAELKSRGGVRSIRDFAGVFENTSFYSGQVRGDLQVHKNHWPLIEGLVELNAPCGFSIAAKALMGRDQRGEEIVESIVKINSVDLVSSPAMTNTILESLMKRTGRNQNMTKSMNNFIDILEGNQPVSESAKEEFLKTLYSTDPLIIRKVEETIKKKYGTTNTALVKEQFMKKMGGRYTGKSDLNPKELFLINLK